MTIERTKDEIILRIPAFIDMKEVQRFVDYIQTLEIISKSKATEEEIFTLSQEVKKGWWAKNRSRFIK